MGSSARVVGINARQGGGGSGGLQFSKVKDRRKTRQEGRDFFGRGAEKGGIAPCAYIREGGGGRKRGVRELAFKRTRDEGKK